MGTTSLPPLLLNVTVYLFEISSIHFAYTVISAFTNVLLVNSFPSLHAASVYQPSNVYPAFVGAVGKIITVPSSTFSMGTTSLPPLLLNVTVYLLATGFS